MNKRLTSLACALAITLGTGAVASACERPIGGGGTPTVTTRPVATTRPVVINPLPTPVSNFVIPLQGNLVQKVGQVRGNLRKVRFRVINGAIAVVGTFVGTVTDATGAVLSVTQEIVVGGVQLATDWFRCNATNVKLPAVNVTINGHNVRLLSAALTITAATGTVAGKFLCSASNLISRGINIAGGIGVEVIDTINQAIDNL